MARGNIPLCYTPTIHTASSGGDTVRTFRIALAQINPTVGDLDGNTGKIIEYVELARDTGAHLVAFPELAIPGYPPEDLLFKPQFIQANIAKMLEVAAASRGIAVVVGFVDAGAYVHNAAAVAYDGEVVGKYHKMHLPNYGVFDEERYFQAGVECPVFTICGTPVGVNICEDIWHSVGPTVVQRAAGAEVVVNISASPFYAGKRRTREKMLAVRAADNGLFAAYVNIVGGQDELVFDGASIIHDPLGEEVARGAQFEEDLVVADLDVESVFRSRLRDKRPRRQPQDALGDVGRPARLHVSDAPGVSAAAPSVVPVKAVTEGRPPDGLDGAAEVYAALALGTRDYVRKTGFDKVFVALSGGIDSSVVAAIAADALGHENVIGVAMPSRYSSEGSVLDAMELADRLEMELWEIPIEETFGAYLNTLESRFRDTEPGVAEENLQSRIRGTLMMALVNKFGGLALTTGNKSEMAVGYATIYGDMAGGYAVIKDVPKTMVYELARYRNSVGGRPPIPDSVLSKPPSAELRPEQKDEDSLPPYETLDPILKAYVEDDLGFDEIVGLGFDESVVKQVVTLVDRSEHKRRQAPPGIKITPRNFGRDRRMPIANRYRPF